MNEKNHLFSNHALKMLLIPLVAEQFLTSLMGTADSMMVSNVGSRQFQPSRWWIPSTCW